MEQTIRIIIGVLVSGLIIIAIVIFFFALPSGQQQQQGSINQPPYTSNVTVVTNPTQRIQEVFRAELAKNQNDNTKLYDISIAGDYALQVYAGDVLGGQALLMYDRTKNDWIFVDGGGGAWSVEGLVVAGVPEQTAEALLKGLYN